MEKYICVSKSKVNNLKNVSVNIPRDSFTVITGPSGSGKSSLAFDTIYAEGQRRYLESLNSYAKQFIDQLAPPDVESITGLSPSIAIDQKTVGVNPRSTVGTITEIYDYLRLLYAKLGIPHCPQCSGRVKGYKTSEILDDIVQSPKGARLEITSPAIQHKKGEQKDFFSKYLAQGFIRFKIDGETQTINEAPKLDKNKYHNIEIVLDRIVNKPDTSSSRLSEAIQKALDISGGLVKVYIDGIEKFYSQSNGCLKCGISFPDLSIKSFSFNGPLGACATCNGLGESRVFTIEGILDDKNKSIFEGAIPVLKKNTSFLNRMIESFFKQEKIKATTPLSNLPKTIWNNLFHGSEKIYTYSFESDNSVFKFKKPFPGLIPFLTKKHRESSGLKIQEYLETFLTTDLCSSCKGQRLAPFPLSVTIQNKNIIELCNLSLENTLVFFKDFKLTKNDALIGKRILKEITSRLTFLNNVGLKYLTLNRPGNKLSGGESQRIRLATQIGNTLCGVIYVLDEPSIGLHPRDNSKLIDSLKGLKENGNTVIVVEHDEETILAADYLIDIGPGAGENGGEILFCGSPAQLKSKTKTSPTAKAIYSKKEDLESIKRIIPSEWLTLTKAHKFNIKNINVKFPLKCLVSITGVSGSGKSTLLQEILSPAVRDLIKSRSLAFQSTGALYETISNTTAITGLIELDQGPIGRGPRSVPVTYSGAFDLIRTIFSQTVEAKVRGYKIGRFSFNLSEGRCEHCKGDGIIKIEMHFLPEVEVICDYCNGDRYNDETLQIHYKGKNISDILNMSFSEASAFFQNHTQLHKILSTYTEIGLGYLKLGQPSTTLSGGEAQRVKLGKELSKGAKGHYLYLLDEPTTGLHYNDILLLIKTLKKIVDNGHTVFVIEHNVGLIRESDWIVDMGPEGGDQGGKILISNNPVAVAKNKQSLTGKYL